MLRSHRLRITAFALLAVGILLFVGFTQARGKLKLENIGLLAGRERTQLGAPLETENKHLRVLLIGNSYTLHHALSSLLERVGAAVSGGPPLTVEAVAHGGYTLRQHLQKGEALQRISAGHYTHVVLQGHSLSALDHPDELVADAERFKQAIDAARSRTVFYATWARSPDGKLYRTHRRVRSFTDMSMRVSTAYFELSQQLGAALAPVGSAFERALIEYPKLALWGPDGSHPSLAGSYTAACVLYGAITGRDPSQTRFVPEGMSQQDAELLRTIAAESLQSARSSLMATSKRKVKASDHEMNAPL